VFFFVLHVELIMSDQIYNCNLEISPTQAIIKRNWLNWLMHSKVTGLPETLQPLE
jgi:hypothetical protein